jgi:hypothetical protein
VTNRHNFRMWFGDPIRKLFDEREAGFVIAMTSFPSSNGTCGNTLEPSRESADSSKAY